MSRASDLKCLPGSFLNNKVLEGMKMAEQKTAAAADDGIRDGFKQLGIARMLLLGCQHVFAMFGATVLVPLITGFNVSIT